MQLRKERHSSFDFNEKTKLFHFEQNLNFEFDDEAKELIYKKIYRRKFKIISFQLASCYKNPILKKGKFFPRGKKYSKIQMIKNIKKNIKWLNLIKNKSTKIAVENNNYFKTGAYEHVTDTDFINLITKNFLYIFYLIIHMLK